MPVESGAESQPLEVDYGDSTIIEILVTAEDGTNQLYDMTILRIPAG